MCLSPTRGALKSSRTCRPSRGSATPTPAPMPIPAAPLPLPRTANDIRRIQTYPGLARARRCRLVVVGVEVGGRSGARCCRLQTSRDSGILAVVTRPFCLQKLSATDPCRNRMRSWLCALDESWQWSPRRRASPCCIDRRCRRRPVLTVVERRVSKEENLFLFS